MPPSPSLRRTWKSSRVWPVRSADAIRMAGEGVVLLRLSMVSSPQDETPAALQSAACGFAACEAASGARGSARAEQLRHREAVAARVAVAGEQRRAVGREAQ